VTKTITTRLAAALSAVSLLAACSGSAVDGSFPFEPALPAPSAAAAPALPVPAASAKPVAEAPALPVVTAIDEEPQAAPEPEPAVTPEPTPEPEPVVDPVPTEPEPEVETFGRLLLPHYLGEDDTWISLACVSPGDCNACAAVLIDAGLYDEYQCVYQMCETADECGDGLVCRATSTGPSRTVCREARLEQFQICASDSECEPGLSCELGRSGYSRCTPI
jgi:hypothetical protein